jgi:hypothetical protein
LRKLICRNRKETSIGRKNSSPSSDFVDKNEQDNKDLQRENIDKEDK